MIARQWIDLVFHHPLLYLQVRAAAFRWVFTTPDLKACVPEEVGVSSDLPDDAKFLGLTPRWDRRDVALAAYVDAFIGTPVLSHITYFLIACAAMGFLFKRRRPPDIPVAMMLASAVAFAASFFVISIACDYRYLLFLDFSALAGLFYIALTTDIRDFIPRKRW
jgi:hypothetical protein